MEILGGLGFLLVPLLATLPAVWLYKPTIWLFKWNKRRKLGPNTCPSCGYDLTGNESGVCPECGVGAETSSESA